MMILQKESDEINERLTCNECGNGDCAIVVQIGIEVDYGVGQIWVCNECLTKAVELVTKAQNDTRWRN